MRCLLTGQNKCQHKIEPQPNQYFLAYPYKDEYEDLQESITSILTDFEVSAYKAKDEASTKHILCKICHKMQESSFGIFEISKHNANVMLELGHMIGMGKPTIILRKKGSRKMISDLGGVEYILYTSMKDLKHKLIKLKPVIEQFVIESSRTSQHVSTINKVPKNIKRVEPRKRDDIISGITRRMTTGCGSLYVTINYDNNGIQEIFCTLSKSGACSSSHLEAICTLLSLSLSSGVDPNNIINGLKSVRCPNPGWEKGGMVLSCSDAIAKAIERSLLEINI